MTIGDYIKAGRNLPSKANAIVDENDRQFKIVNFYGSVFWVYKNGWTITSEAAWQEDSNDYAKVRLLEARRHNGK